MVDCSEGVDDWGATREMDVRFWGAVDTKDTVFKCQKMDAEIVCHMNK